MKRLLFTIILSTLFSTLIYSQGIAVKFKILFQNEDFSTDKSYFHSILNDSIRFNKLSFYISDCKALTDSGNEIVLDKRFFLLHFNDSNQVYLGNFQTNKSIKHVSFTLGIDSTTNVSGAMDGDLDPMHGMYWAWQSGYINFKLEGSSPICNSRKNRFQYHLGGYAHPFESAQLVELDNIVDNKAITIVLSIDKLFEAIDFQESTAIMSPSKEAVALSHVITNLFQLEK